ncbi:MAG: hypothetical protein HN726_03540 [Candidatus Magasanikbacteria bacterium]|nr:hypothetical protein [Candidatus Magasanikbacteria bacterium]
MVGKEEQHLEVFCSQPYMMWMIENNCTDKTLASQWSDGKDYYGEIYLYQEGQQQLSVYMVWVNPQFGQKEERPLPPKKDLQLIAAKRATRGPGSDMWEYINNNHPREELDD